MIKSQPLAGVYPILATTSGGDGRPDSNSQVSLVDYLLEQGAHGFGLFGNASEGYALRESEREELLRLIVRRVDGRVPLVVSTGHSGTYAAAELSRAAEAEGASALRVLPPYYMKTDAEGLILYCSAIASAVKIPIMAQDAPLATQVALPPALLARMSQEIENLRYVKVEAPPTGEKIRTILNLSDGKLTVFGGLNGYFLYEELERGALGVMPNSDITAIYGFLRTFGASGHAHAFVSRLLKHFSERHAGDRPGAGFGPPLIRNCSPSSPRRSVFAGGQETGRRSSVSVNARRERTSTPGMT
jgi:2-keto-3-deoxy-L-arabinonate dehydratase